MTTALHMPVEQIEADIAKYSTWLKVPAVQASSKWTADIEARVKGLRLELRRIRTAQTRTARKAGAL